MALSEDREKLLAARACQGDIEAFEELISSLRLMVINTAMQYLGNMDDAMDCSQDVFLNAYRNIRSFRGGSFRAWVYSITRNRCMDMLRSRKTYVVSLDAPDDEGAPAPDPEAAPGDMPEEYLIGKARREALRAAMSRLPEKLRDVCILRHVQEMSYEEISDILDIPVGTVKSRLNSAMKSLRRELSDNIELFR